MASVDGDTVQDEDRLDPTLSFAGGDERRMQVRAYNFWAGLLGSRTFPDVADLKPDDLPDFGPFSVLLDFTQGLENPAIAYLGAQLAGECDASGAMARLNDVPARSLLSRITDHYLQIIANQTPIGFEAEFVNQRGATILYRGILLPFSRDDTNIDFIFGVINWKELSAQAAAERLEHADEPVDTRPAMLRGVLDAPLTEWADGPVDFVPSSDVRIGSLYPARESGLVLPEPGFIGAEVFSLDAEFEVRSADAFDGAHGLADWLASARELAQAAQGCEDRTRHALYAAIGRAHDFALAAAAAPEDLTELLEDAGLKAQPRAPLLPLVKLVFGADYDKTRLTEFATAIAHAQRLGLGTGDLARHLAVTPGGLKAVVREERRLRRDAAPAEAAGEAPRERLARELRTLEPLQLDDIAAKDEEFTVLIAHRLDSGEVVLLGEIADDDLLLQRAARRLLA